MRWRRLAMNCQNGPCPSVWEAEDGTVAVMGPEVEEAVRPTPGPGETVVRIPREVLLDAARLMEGRE